MFILQEQPVHYDILIAGYQIDMNQFEASAQVNDLSVVCTKLTSSSSATSSSEDDVSTDDNDSSVVGSPIDRSYTVQDM